MFAIKSKVKRVKGKRIDTLEREVIEPGTVLLAEAGTSGYKGGAGRETGCRAYISIECLCGDFRFSPVIDEDGNVMGIDITCCGDAALDAIIKALNFTSRVIDEQRNEVDD